MRPKQENTVRFFSMLDAIVDELQDLNRICLRSQAKNLNFEADHRLVMTLLVRNEVDVIEGNLRFHLDHGVDFIVVTDNGSSDGTTEILEEYAKMGVVHLIHEPSRIFHQQTWVNEMGQRACSKFAADIVFHADADELWQPASGSLKRELAVRNRVDVLSVPVKNMMLVNKDGDERFPHDVTYEVNNPINKPVHKVMAEVAQRSFFLYRYPNKVIYKTHRGYINVVQGNHDIDPKNTWREFIKQASFDIEILHFPVRGFKQFQQKVINNGEGLENLDLHIGSNSIYAWHVKRWYALYKLGQLTEEYHRLLDLDEYLDVGILAPLSQQRKQALRYYEGIEYGANDMTWGI